MRFNLFIEIKEFKDEYLDELEYHKKSKNTLENYESVIESFIRFIEEKLDVKHYEDFRVGNFIKFLKWKEDQTNMHLHEYEHISHENSTKNKYILILRNFFSYCSSESKEKFDMSNIFKSKRLQFKVTKTPPKGISKPEHKELIINEFNERIRLCCEYKESKQIVSYRNSLMFKLYLFSGARASELLQVKLKDFKSYDENLYTIKVIGKGEKRRNLLIKKEQINIELSFLKKSNLTYLAQTTRDLSAQKTMDRTQVFRMLQRVYNKIGIANTKIGIHGLRHQFAKDVYASTKDLQLVQQLLDHSNIQTTSIYSQDTEENVIRKYKELDL